MIQLVLVGVAAWMAYEAVRAALPIPSQIQPLLVIAACYGLTLVPQEVIMALDSAAVAALARLIVTRLQSPNVDVLPRGWQRKGGRIQSPRIPDLP